MSSTYSPAVAASPFVSVEEYLRTSYRPDCDYRNGSIQERNVGEFEHSRVQLMLATIFVRHEQEWSVVTAPECRLQVAEDHFRVPDVMVLRRGTKVSRIVREAPLLCIEVLSPEDTFARMFERFDDYLNMGIAHVWCFDPETRKAWRYTAASFAIVSESELTVPGTAIRVNVSEVFAILDEQ